MHSEFQNQNQTKPPVVSHLPRAESRGVKPPKSVFLAATIVIFFLSLSAADSIGLVPSYLDESQRGVQNKVALSNLPQLGETNGVLPERIVAPTISLDLPIQNPDTRDVALLDEALQNGPVRYTDSAKLGEKGNILIFAHSSHLPIVHNQMYKAFNRISELKVGDSITVSGGGNDYLYAVTSVRLTDANDEIIDLSKTNGTHLTLSTCDTFGKKSARFVVEADFIGVFPTGN